MNIFSSSLPWWLTNSISMPSLIHKIAAVAIESLLLGCVPRQDSQLSQHSQTFNHACCLPCIQPLIPAFVACCLPYMYPAFITCSQHCVIPKPFTSGWQLTNRRLDLLLTSRWKATLWKFCRTFIHLPDIPTYHCSFTSLIPRPLPDWVPIFLHSCKTKSGSGLRKRPQFYEAFPALIPNSWWWRPGYEEWKWRKLVHEQQPAAKKKY